MNISWNLYEYAFEKKIFQDEINKAIAKYPAIANENLIVKYSGKMTKALGYCHGKYKFSTSGLGKLYKDGFKDFKITLSKSWRKVSNVEEMVKTFRHELAHMIEAVYYKEFSHSRTWAKICKDLGGSMNDEHASYYDGEGISQEAITNKKSKYVYTCSCGKCTLERERKISTKVLFGHVCKNCKAKVVTFKMIQNF